MKLFTFTFAALVAFCPGAQAGPPLICHPLDIGQAQSLPWVTHLKNWDGADPSYDRSRLIGDTLNLLAPGAPVLVRMETIRRAAVYSGTDPATGFDLLSRLMARAMSNGGDALAWFDAGYMAETLRQFEHRLKRKVPAEFDGYAWTRKAIQLAGTNPEMEYAASLIQSNRSWPNEHLQRAKAAARPGSLLARNIENWK